MPRYRWDLTRRDQVKHLARAKWLVAAGAQIEIEKFMFEPSPVRIDQYGPQFNNMVFNQHQFGIGIVVGVKLLASKPKITICDCKFALHLENIQVSLFCVSDKTRFYSLTKGVQFHRDEVLNHRINEGLSLRAGQPLDGLLIATGSPALPERCCHGATVNAELTFVDQFDNDYAGNVELVVNRRVGGTLHVRHPRKESTLYDPRGSTFDGCQSTPKNSNEVRPHGKAEASGSELRAAEEN